MIRYESQVTIDRPPEDVYPYLVEREKQALWSDVPMRPVSEGPLTTGSRLEVFFGMGPLKATVGLEITALEPDRRMAFRTYSGPIRWTGEYRLSPAGTGSQLGQEGTLEFTGLWRLLQPLVGAEISRAEVKELEKLKRVVESA